MKLGCVRVRRGRVAVLAGIVGVAATVAVSFSSPAEAARRRHHTRSGGYNPPYADMVVDVKSGRVLHAVNEDALRHPASITKVMTLYLLFEALERGTVSLDTPLRVSAHAAAQAPSKLGLRPGATIEVEDAIKAIVTKSANDIAVVIAENLGGSEEAFAEMMTQKARALGMKRTAYRNASGLPDPGQITTAHDLTILAQAIQDRFPRYYRYFQTRVFTYAGRSIPNHNHLLGRIEGVDGIKTGFTRDSGFNLMTNVRTDDRHIVAVILGGRSAGIRDRMMADLIRTNLPRAYAGNRTAPVVAEASRPAKPEVETTSATTRVPAPRPNRQPLDLATVRPVVASAAGAASTTTPSAMRWKTGPQGIPHSAEAYAAAEAPAASPMPLPSAPARPEMAQVGKIEARLPETVVAKAEPPAPPRPAATRSAAAPRPAMTSWVIQLGATDDEGKAKSILDDAKSRSGRTLAHASPFTEKVVRDGTTLYRARFSGFDESDEAQDACKVLKRDGFACFATRS